MNVYSNNIFYDHYDENIKEDDLLYNKNTCKVEKFNGLMYKHGPFYTSYATHNNVANPDNEFTVSYLYENPQGKKDWVEQTIRFKLWPKENDKKFVVINNKRSPHPYNYCPRNNCETFPDNRLLRILSKHLKRKSKKNSH